jgi:hypothetical protein
MSISKKGRDSKRTYQAPSLTLYGSVRDLTGDGSGAMADGTNMMMA